MGEGAGATYEKVPGPLSQSTWALTRSIPWAPENRSIELGSMMDSKSMPLVGRIGYSLKRGGYYVMDNPRRQSGAKFILNQNYRVLKSWHRRGRAVTIQGRVDPANFLATHIVIDWINGRPYRGTHAPLMALP